MHYRQIVAVSAAVVMTGWALTAFAAHAFAAGGQDAAPALRVDIDVSALGPQVGEQVPDFSLPDKDGTIWTRESIMGPNGAMLVFVRSADW